MVIKALVTAFGIDEKEITKEFKRIGDIGELAEQLNLKQKTKNLVLTILEVFGELEKIANTTGEGSVEKKN
jgi:DNA ligase-1